MPQAGYPPTQPLLQLTDERQEASREHLNELSGASPGLENEFDGELNLPFRNGGPEQNTRGAALNYVWC